MFLQTPDTSAYMIGGYIFAFTAMAIYLVSLMIRFRNLKRDFSMLEDLDQEASQKK